MALGSTQPLTEMSTRSISWGKGGRCVRLTTWPPSCAVVMKSGNFNFLEPSGPLQACDGTALPSYYLSLSLALSFNLSVSLSESTPILYSVASETLWVEGSVMTLRFVPAGLFIEYTLRYLSGNKYSVSAATVWRCFSTSCRQMSFWGDVVRFVCV